MTAMSHLANFAVVLQPVSSEPYELITQPQEAPWRCWPEETVVRVFQEGRADVLAGRG